MSSLRSAVVGVGRMGIDRVLESLRPGSCWLDARTRRRFAHSRARGRSGQLADLSGLVNPLG